MIESEISQKVAYLESLGLEIESYDKTNPLGDATICFSDLEGYWEVEVDSFEVGDTLVEIQRASIEFSPCCGISLDDHRTCPICKNRY
jgi:hypothetical protein